MEKHIPCSTLVALMMHFMMRFSVKLVMWVETLSFRITRLAVCWHQSLGNQLTDREKAASDFALGHYGYVWLLSTVFFVCLLCYCYCVVFVAEKVVSNLLASWPEHLCKCFLFASLVCRVIGFVFKCQLLYLGMGSHPCFQPWKVCTIVHCLLWWSKYLVPCDVLSYL